MRNRKSGSREPRAWSLQIWSTLSGFLLVAAFASAAALGWAQPAFADQGGVKGHTFDVTFTKWISGFPNMSGIVGGDVGPGTFTGEILNYAPGTEITKIEALYHLHGSRHSLTAHVFVTENELTGMASIAGDVTEGWLDGTSLTGEYKVWSTCPIPTPGNTVGSTCFQGTLYLHRGGQD